MRNGVRSIGNRSVLFNNLVMWIWCRTFLPEVTTINLLFTLDSVLVLCCRLS